ncbi:MAG: Fe-S cluster assembly ATPase SufC [Actinobacteria bacterium]|nr:Fe-S cluster assembly ATPase SufC [Actinomycetota bacterium]
MSTLAIHDLQARVPGRDILRGIDLTVSSGEVHAVMGPNGSGKSTLSHVLMGRPGYEVTGGSVTLDGQDLLALPTWERAQAGLFLSMQYPIEVPGVSLLDALEAAFAASEGRAASEVRELISVEAGRLGVEPRFLSRPLNVDLSGGERKRNETLQLAVVRPRIAVLDEIDSGLDVDALRTISRRIEAATAEDNLGVLAITHYSRLLHELRPDVVHVLSGGRIVATGGPELAAELEVTGYALYGGAADDTPTVIDSGGEAADPFADPLA